MAARTNEPSATAHYLAGRRAFLATWRTACACSVDVLELREERGRLECATHGAPVVRARELDESAMANESATHTQRNAP